MLQHHKQSSLLTHDRDHHHHHPLPRSWPADHGHTLPQHHGHPPPAPTPQRRTIYTFNLSTLSRSLYLGLCGVLALGILSIANTYLFQTSDTGTLPLPPPQTTITTTITTTSNIQPSDDIPAQRVMFEIDTTDVSYQAAYSYILTLWGAIILFAIYYQATRLSLYYTRKSMLYLAAAHAECIAIKDSAVATLTSSPAGVLAVPTLLTAPKRSFESRGSNASPRSPFRGWLGKRISDPNASTISQSRITDTAQDASQLIGAPADPTAYFSFRVLVYQTFNYTFAIPTVTDVATVHQAFVLLAYVWINVFFIVASPFTFSSTPFGLPSASDFADRAAYLGLANLAFMVPFATRNSVFPRLLGVSFERMITYHRWFGRTGFLLISYHASWHVSQNYFVMRDSFKAAFGTFQFGYGTSTYTCLLCLALFSHEFFRRRYYEFFCVTHILGFLFLIMFGTLHNDAFLPFMASGLVFWIIDRAIRFYRSWIEPIRVVEIKQVQGEITRVIFEKGAPGSSGENRAGQAGALVGFMRGIFGGWGWRFKAGQYVFVSFGGQALDRGKGGWTRWTGWTRWHPATISGFANPVIGGEYGEDDADDVDLNYEQFQIAQDQLLAEGVEDAGVGLGPAVAQEELEMQNIHPVYQPRPGGISSPDPYVPQNAGVDPVPHHRPAYSHHEHQSSQSSNKSRTLSFIASVAGHKHKNSLSNHHRSPSSSATTGRTPPGPGHLVRQGTGLSMHAAATGFFASVHIKALGDHTRALYETLSALRSDSNIDDNEKYLHPSNGLAARVPVRIDGPYGMPTVEFQDHKVAVLMACGIGITPMMALARDLVVRRTEGVETVRTEEVWLIWSVPDQEHYGTFATDLTYLSTLSSVSHQSQYPCTLNVRIHTTQSTPMNASVALVNKHNHAFIPGRPNIKKTMRAIKDANRMEDVGVCVCGPPEFVRRVKNTAVWTCSDAGGVWWVQEEKFVL